MPKQDYITYPGRTKQDNDFCLTCKWHSILQGGFVCCDYSLQDTHGLRGCRIGVGCDKWESGKRQAAAVGSNGGKAKRNRPDMTTYSREAHKALLLVLTRKQIAEITGETGRNVGNWVQTGRIKRASAMKIYEATGIDVTGGEFARGSDTKEKGEESNE